MGILEDGVNRPLCYVDKFTCIVLPYAQELPQEDLVSENALFCVLC